MHLVCVLESFPSSQKMEVHNTENTLQAKKTPFAHVCQYSSSEKLNWVDQCYMSTLSLKQSSLDTLLSCSFANKSGLRGRYVVHNCVATQLLQIFFPILLFSVLQHASLTKMHFQRGLRKNNGDVKSRWAHLLE